MLWRCANRFSCCLARCCWRGADGPSVCRGADGPAPQFYTRIATPDSNTVQLQIVLRKFVPEQEGGPAIWLAGVMHVGEPEYYHALQLFLDKQTVVLYEGINASAHPRRIDSGRGAGANEGGGGHRPPPQPPRRHERGLFDAVRAGPAAWGWFFNWRRLTTTGRIF
jgi:hypothetical protein